MKTIVVLTKKFAGLLTLIALTCVSCSDDALNSVNEDNDHPTSVEAKYILAEVITSTAFHNVGGDLNTYFAAYTEHEVGVHNQLWRAETRSGEPSSSTTFNNTWESLYTALRDARIIIAQCSEGGAQEGNYVTRGIAEVLAALNSAIITDAFGDAPWSEAALVNADGSPQFMTPKIDKQEDIYNGIFVYLDNAIADLQNSDVSPAGSYDLLYGGDANKWLKLAYGLKARYTLRLLARAADKDAELDKALNYIDRSFASADEQAAFNIYDANNLNPLFDFQWSRDALAASQSLASKLIERNDPRLRRVFVNADWIQVTGADDENYFMAPNGESEQVQYYYNTSIFVFSQTAATMLLSYHELLFLKAEALARKGDAQAADVLQAAVVAAIANTEASIDAAMNAPTVLRYGGLEATTDAISPDEAATYFNTEVKPLANANLLKEVMVQKYLAFFGASGESPEAYNDIRRLKALGEDSFIPLANTRKFPLRCGYGNSDTTTNPNVQTAFGDGQYVYSENVWWAGGTR